MNVKYEVFRAGSFVSWHELFDRAATFAGSLDPGSLISISHSDSQGRGIVVVWYRDAVDAGKPPSSE